MMLTIDATVVVRGGGDIASGTILRLHRCGFRVAVLELPEPLVVRRSVSFARAVQEGCARIEQVRAVLVHDAAQCAPVWQRGDVPVLIDPTAAQLQVLMPDVVVDATLAKRNLGTTRQMAPNTIGPGPGFTAGDDVDAVVETKEGHHLGRVLYAGAALPDTGLSVPLCGYSRERVLRAPVDGSLRIVHDIGETVIAGDCVAEVEGTAVVAQIGGVVRGMIRDGSRVTAGLKIGDIDPLAIRSYCYTVFDKARAIAGGVLEAICCLHRQHIPAAVRADGW